MPAVGDLNGRRRALPRTLGVCAGAITADQFNAGILLEPVCQRRRFAVRKQINCIVPLKIYQDRAVILSFMLCPVVDSDDLWGGRRRQWCLADPLNKRIWADAHPQSSGQPSPGLAARDQTDQS